MASGITMLWEISKLMPIVLSMKMVNHFYHVSFSCNVAISLSFCLSMSFSNVFDYECIKDVSPGIIALLPLCLFSPSLHDQNQNSAKFQRYSTFTSLSVGAIHVETGGSIWNTAWIE